MKNKGAVRFLAILLAVVCLYELSFTFITNGVEKDATEWAERMADGDASKVKDLKRQYLDSMAYEKVYGLGLVDYTYLEAKEKELNLGLDLQGGMSVTLEVSVPSILRALSKNSEDATFEAAMEKAEEMQKSSEENFVTLFSQAWNEANTENKSLSAIFSNSETKEVLSFSSTDEEVLKYLREESKAALGRSLQIIRSRVDRFGVAQPNVQLLEGSGRILVELPGVDNPDRVRKLLQGSAKLEFWETYTLYDVYNQQTGFMEAANKAASEVLKGNTDIKAEEESVDTNATEDTTTAELNTELEADTANADSADSLSADTTAADTTMTLEEYKAENPLFFYLKSAAITGEGASPMSSVIGIVSLRDYRIVNELISHPKVKSTFPNNLVLMWEKSERGDTLMRLHALKKNRANDGPVLPGDVITDARPDISQTGKVEVQMTMNAKGQSEWKKITTEAAGVEGDPSDNKNVAIVLDGLVYSAPRVDGPIPNGVSSITMGSSGLEARNEAEDLANILKAGKLPAPAQVVEEAIVGPSLGQKSIEQGTTALIVGFSAVILFMMFYYTGGGVVSVLALIANLFFILGALASKGAALTLPGIAGLVLTIGMSVDANVLIFERIREELRLGKGVKTALANGYKAAFSSIIDANLTTLLAGIVLILFGSGPVYGFAIILIIGIISSLFTAILVTRLIFEWYMKKDKDISFGSNFTNNLFANLQFNFIAKRRIAYVVSGIIILAGTVSLFTKGLSQGVDFSGGWSYTIQFNQDVAAGDIRNALTEPFGKAPEVKTFGTNNTYKITTTYLINETDTGSAEKVKSALMSGLAQYNITDADIQVSSKVGPTIADDIKRDSTWAVIFAIIGIFAYIVLRFRKWQYGLGATVALFHDVMMVFSAFTLLDGIVPFTLEVDQAFIAAVLTVIGYSINDTVVVFDRIREFLQLHRTEKNTTMVINNAINQTLSRSLITSLTTLLVVLILFIFGGEVLKGFTFALLVGVLVGTYSSVFIATPIVVDLTKKDNR